MKIASSDIQLSSRHAAIENREVKESLRAWIGERRPNFEHEGRRPGSVLDVDMNPHNKLIS